MKKNLLFLFAIFAYSLHAQTFVQKTDFPGGNRFKMFTLTHGSKIFCGLGIDDVNTMHTDLWQYETTTDTWTQLNDFPVNPRRNAFGCSIAGTIYLGFGYDGTASLNDWWMYDSIADSWTQKTSLPAAPRYWGSAFECNGKGYVIGGEKYNGTYTDYNDLWEYNPTNDTWTQLSNFVGNARCLGFCQPVSNTIFYGLGEAANVTTFSDMYKYDCNAQTWTPIAPIPPLPNVPVVDGGAWWSAAYNNNLILMNVNLNGTINDDYNSIYVYDIATDTWTIYQLANTAGYRFLGIGGQYGSKAYVGAGYDVNSALQHDMWEVDLAALLTGLDEQNPELKNINVFVANHQINFSIPQELFSQENLSLDLYSTDGKLISSNCMMCSKFIDVSKLPSGNYVYVVKTENRNLKSGKIFIN